LRLTGGQYSSYDTTDHQEEDREYQQDHKPIEADVEKEPMHREQLPVIPEKPRRIVTTER
jgi:hypothetical protein